MLKKIDIATNYVKSKTDIIPEIGIILGSGLGNLGNKISNAIKIPYSEIPEFPVSTVEGHSGMLIIGEFGGKKVIAMQGRFHYYEGYKMEMVTLPVRVMKRLGVHTMFVSNAAGGLNPKYKAGDLMIIEDHINFFPQNALLGKNIDELGPRFPDMSQPYNFELIKTAEKIAKEENINVHKGVYIGSSGPTLETKAEYRMLRILGADATGMSTVPEVIVGVHMGLKIFGMSVITNVSEPEDPSKETTHEEVQDVAGMVEPQMTKIFTQLIKSL